MEQLKYKPLAFWILGESGTTFQDYSGYDMTAGVSTSKLALPTASDAEFSQVFSSSNEGWFSTPVYNPGTEGKSFSLSVSFAVIGDMSETEREGQVLSSLSGTDGIVIKNGVLSFATKYANTGEATCSYVLPRQAKVDVVAVHSINKNTLYVNGELVSEVDVTSEQQSDTFVGATDGKLYSKGEDNSELQVNSVGIYGKELSPEEVLSIYQASNRRAEGSVPKMFDGEDILIGSSARPAEIEAYWNVESDWESAQLIGVVIEDDSLAAQIENQQTLAGYWIDSVNLYQGDVSESIESAYLNWSGIGETVEVSLDGESWTTAVKNTAVPFLTGGVDSTDKSLYIKVSFDEGLAEAFVSNMYFRAYTTSSVTINNRTIDYSDDSVVFDDIHPAEFDEEAGVQLNSGGIVIHPDTISEDPSPIRSIEVWVRPWSVDIQIPATTTKYINGIESTGPLNTNQWNVVHFVSSTPVTGDIEISGLGQVNRVVAYEASLTQSQIETIIRNYTGIQKMSYDGSGFIGLQEPNDSVAIYSHDWQIVTTG